MRREAAAHLAQGRPGLESRDVAVGSRSRPALESARPPHDCPRRRRRRPSMADRRVVHRPAGAPRALLGRARAGPRHARRQRRGRHRELRRRPRCDHRGSAPVRASLAGADGRREALGRAARGRRRAAPGGGLAPPRPWARVVGVERCSERSLEPPPLAPGADFGRHRCGARPRNWHDLRRVADGDRAAGGARGWRRMGPGRSAPGPACRPRPTPGARPGGALCSGAGAPAVAHRPNLVRHPGGSLLPHSRRPHGLALECLRGCLHRRCRRRRSADGARVDDRDHPARAASLAEAHAPPRGERMAESSRPQRRGGATSDRRSGRRSLAGRSGPVRGAAAPSAHVARRGRVENAPGWVAPDGHPDRAEPDLGLQLVFQQRELGDRGLAEDHREPRGRVAGAHGRRGGDAGGGADGGARSPSGPRASTESPTSAFSSSAIPEKGIPPSSHSATATCSREADPT